MGYQRTGCFIMNHDNQNRTDVRFYVRVFTVTGHGCCVVDGPYPPNSAAIGIEVCLCCRILEWDF